MAKRVRVSPDNGSNWYTLPGNTGEVAYEAGDLEDTIFGQDYASGQTGLIGSTLSANGLYKGFAGYVAKIMRAGSPTGMVDEAMSLVSGKTYQITAATKRVLDRTDTFVVEDNNLAVSGANIESIDHLLGRVTFVSGYTPTTPITITGDYLPMTQVARGKTFTLTQTATPIDDTDFDSAQGNDGHRTWIYGLKQAALEIGGIFASSNAFQALVAARAELIIEINPDGNQKSLARGYFKPMSQGQSGDVGALEEETISFTLSVPDDADLLRPFTWYHASDTTLSQAVRECLTAWQAGTLIDFQYLYDGTNGYRADGVITNLTLTGGLEAMNEFAVEVQLSDELTPVP